MQEFLNADVVVELSKILLNFFREVVGKHVKQVDYFFVLIGFFVAH